MWARKNITQAFFSLILLASSVFSHAESANDYKNIKHAFTDNIYEVAGLFGAITYLGVKEWDWGSSEFTFNSEGWFDMDTGSGGADKLGHLYSSYLMSEFLANRMAGKGYSNESSAYYSSLFAWTFMFYVEIFDGYSSDHGFSYEDLIANTAGIGVSYLKTRYPNTIGDTLDLRIEYSPSEGLEGFHPITDYTGMKYLAAVKFAGIDALKSTPLKYFDVQAGYFTRGFLKEDRPYFDEKRTELFVGVGLNLTELLFKPLYNKKYVGKAARYASTVTDYFQLPHISARTTLSERRQELD